MAKYTIEASKWSKTFSATTLSAARARNGAARARSGACWAELYVAALGEAAGGDAVAESATEVNEAAADVAVSAETVEAREVARRLARVELGR